MKISKLAFALVAAAGIAAAQDAITIDIDGAGTCQLQSWAFGATNSGSLPSTGGGAGAGKAQISALVLNRQLDKCSTVLFGMATSGKHAGKATLTQKDANGRTVMLVKLEMVFVGSYQVSGTTTNPLPVETVALTFVKIEFDYSGPGGPSEAGWDLSKNAAANLP